MTNGRRRRGRGDNHAARQYRDAPELRNPLATPFPIGGQPQEGLRTGALAPELSIDLDDGTTYPPQDLDGRPITLAAIRGKVV